MERELKKKTEEWMTMERKTFEERAKADKFYEENLMHGIVKEFIKNNKTVVSEPVKYLIVSVGTSYEPIVLTISLLKPEKIHFLYTTESEKTIDKVAQFCNLKFSQVEKSKVVETESLDVYREIKKCYLAWDKPNKMYIDFTGGTKAMSTAAAMAGSVINVQMVYCGSNQYMSDFRKPYPGSERLYVISNPMSVFGDLEIDKAFSLFDQCNYAGACEKLEVLKENVPDPVVRQNLSNIYLLAKTYEYWDALEFQKAYQSIRCLVKNITRDSKNGYVFLLPRNHVLVKCQETILCHLNELYCLVKEKRQKEILAQKELIYPLMFTMYQNALIREKQEKYDMSTLLLYRLLEMIEQRRLIQYNLYVSKMDYMNIKNAPDTAGEDVMNYLKDRVVEIKKEVFGRCQSAYLPEQVSLLEGFIILYALQDAMMEGKQGGVVKLKRIRAMVSLRNNSIFAHGLVSVDYCDFTKFKMFVEELFKELCMNEEIDFGEYMNNMHWISPNDIRKDE